MNHPPITLPNDIREAFEQIAGYLRTVRKDRPHHEMGEREVNGHVQTVEWIDGLLELAAEADRLANIADAGAGIPGAPDIGPDPLKLDGEERVRYGGEYVARLTAAHTIQQPGVPDQTALVWRIDLSRVLSELIQTRVRERKPRIYTKCPACKNDTLTINDDHHLLCTWHECPNPIMIDNAGPIIRAAWERGIRLARSYGDNIGHCQGEERERHWKKFISDPIPARRDESFQPQTSTGNAARDAMAKNRGIHTNS